MTAVCSVGLDMITIPGDTSPAIISGIIADEAAIGMVNSKTTAVRVIPAVGRKEGETLTSAVCWDMARLSRSTAIRRRYSSTGADTFPLRSRASRTNSLKKEA